MDPATVPRLIGCVVKIQQQVEKLLSMQSDAAMVMNKISNVVLNLTQNVTEIKHRIEHIEKIRERDEYMRRAMREETIEQSLTCDPTDVFASLKQVTVNRRPRVLVVEDDSAYQWIVSKHLEARGIDCTVAGTGYDALIKLQMDRGFDLVLMDIQLPGGLSGLDATQRIRAFDLDIPIVSMTAATNPRQVAMYLAGGMNDVLKKPFSREDLLSLVGRFCSLSIGDDSDRNTSFLLSCDEREFLTSTSGGSQKATYTFGLI